MAHIKKKLLAKGLWVVYWAFAAVRAGEKLKDTHNDFGLTTGFDEEATILGHIQ